MSNGITMGNIRVISILSAALTPVSVAANTTAEQTFTMPAGLQFNDFVNVIKPTAQAGLGIVNARVTLTGGLAITYINATASPIVPTAETYLVQLNRATNITTNIGD